MVVASTHLGLAAGVLGDRLCALADGVLGQLSRQQQADCGLHLSAAQRRLLVVSRQTPSLTGEALEAVADEAVHDRHGALADTSVRVHLLEHTVDVRAVRLRLGRASTLLAIATRSLAPLRGLRR